MGRKLYARAVMRAATRNAMRGVAGLSRRRLCARQPHRSSSVKPVPNPFEHCAQIVKKGDYDGYLYSLLQGSERRYDAVCWVNHE